MAKEQCNWNLENFTNIWLDFAPKKTNSVGSRKNERSLLFQEEK